MDRKYPAEMGAHPLTRRRFIQGLSAGAALAIGEARGRPLFAESAAFDQPVLSGYHFDLTIDSVPVNFTGHRARATAVNGSAPGPILRWKEGDTVTLAVTNRLKQMTSIHWHGIRLPSAMDGVPGLSFAGIAPGEVFHYRFSVKQRGTYWYHSHSNFQEQTGLIGALIIDPRTKDPIEFDREYVVLLSDWTDKNPEMLFSNLKKQSNYYNGHRATLANFVSASTTNGFGRTFSERLAWSRMNMSPTDIADISGSAYTYLLNGNSPNANWTGLFERGERIRLRFINGSSMTFFDVRIPGLKITVVQADGNDVEPVPVDEFRMAPAETYDVMVQPLAETAYTIFAQSEDRSGFARGTLAPKPGMAAVVPPMDPRPVRTMMDMGMSKMKGMKMGSMAGDASPAMAGMQMDHAVMPVTAMDDGIGKAPFPQPGLDTGLTGATAGAEGATTSMASSTPIRMHVGPLVDNVSMMTTDRMSEPGLGLDGNHRRVLTYADLHSRYRGVDGRPPSREIELHLSGNMERYIWGFNGKALSQSEPVNLKLGERVRFVLINDTMMEHPIHLHGLWSELENGSGESNLYKHTVFVKPAERLSFLVSADTPGQWALHCHLMYHMESGMFRTVVVTP
jgi:CopA family copper-resistance protein